MRGGVAILTKIGASCEELREGAPKQAHPVYSRSAAVFLEDGDQLALKITVVYLLPKGGRTAESVGRLTGTDFVFIF